MSVASKLSQSPSGQLKAQTKKLESSPKHIVVISNQLAGQETDLGDDALINGVSTQDRDALHTDTNQSSAKAGPKVRPLVRRGTLNLGTEVSPRH